MTEDGIISVPYDPRHQFIPFHQRGTRFAAMVAHRRAGKTVACINELIARAIYSKKKKPRYGYIGPYLKQAKKIAWEYLKDYTTGIVAKKPNESELTVVLKHNGAEITIYGADNPDAFRGQYFDGVILDEYGDMSPSVWGKVLLPTLADRRGWAVFIGTPKGKNHFYKIFQRALITPNWYSFILRASESGILPQEELDLQRQEQTEDEYQQEYECSFDAAVVGTYYASLVSKLEAEGRVDARVEFDPEFPVEMATDLGFSDSTAMWFWQDRPDGIAVIDYEEDHGKALPHYFKLLRDKPYKYKKIWLPQDARQKTLQTGRSTLEQFIFAFNEGGLLHGKAHGQDWAPVEIAPELSIQSGIDAARMMLPKCHFNPRCSDGIEALRAYRREYDEDREVFNDKPLHDWSSNGADGFRYLCLVAQGRIVVSDDPRPERLVIEAEPILLTPLFEDREKKLSLNRRRI